MVTFGDLEDAAVITVAKEVGYGWPVKFLRGVELQPADSEASSKEHTILGLIGTAPFPRAPAIFYAGARCEFRIAMIVRQIRLFDSQNAPQGGCPMWNQEAS